MIRWYDYPIAFLVASAMINAFFTIPIIGAFIAYGVHELWMDIYCQWRLKQEDGK